MKKQKIFFFSYFCILTTIHSHTVVFIYIYFLRGVLFLFPCFDLYDNFSSVYFPIRFLVKIELAQNQQSKYVTLTRGGKILSIKKNGRKKEEELNVNPARIV